MTAHSTYFAIERVVRIHRLVQLKKYPSLESLSDIFEVSTRTVKRDVEFMRDRLGMPIAYDYWHGGFCFTGKTKPFLSRS